MMDLDGHVPTQILPVSTSYCCIIQETDSGYFEVQHPCCNLRLVEGNYCEKVVTYFLESRRLCPPIPEGLATSM